jgi:pSer/pThr/pTyr-binding forkhead associated (FHA) protein
MARQVAGRTTQIAPDGAVRIRYERLRARVVRGPDVGREVEVGTEDVGIGSHPSNPLALTDSGVSRFHARLVVGPRGVRLLDLDSANGTRVAGLAVRDVYVTDGLVVELGDSAIGLITADKPDSQDICFVPGGDYTKVVKRLRPEAQKPGTIEHIDGRVLGTHEASFITPSASAKALASAAAIRITTIRFMS